MSQSKVTENVTASSDMGSGSPGAILRRCREFHGITLEEASESTKIGITHLKALEDDQIREFANQAYLKGFLRIYATFLGLNSDDIARLYEKLFGVQVEKNDPSRTAAVSNLQPRRLLSLKKLLFPALLLVAIIITATFFKRPPTPLVRQPAPVAVVPALPLLQNPAVQTIQSSVRVRKKETENREVPFRKDEVRHAELPETETAVALKRPADAVSKGFILKIKATQNGALTAVVDGASAQQYDLTGGDIIEWKAEKKVSLELSNAGGVEVELNGKPYKSLGPIGKPAYVELDADSIK
jgi:cytoskeleton protein RodZ